MDLLLYGFGGFGFSVAEIAIENGYKNIGIFDKNKPENLSISNGTLEFIGQYNGKLFSEIPLLITIGNNEIRAKIASEITHQTISLIHQSALISKSSSIENGSIIMPNVVIGANTIIKKYCIINTSAVIDHDCVLESFIHVRPLAYIGSNSKISSFNIIQPTAFIERFTEL